MLRTVVAVGRSLKAKAAVPNQAGAAAAAARSPSILLFPRPRHASTLVHALASSRPHLLRRQNQPQRRSMFIQTESTPNPESLKYIPGEVVLDEKYGTGMYFRQGEADVNRSPLAKKLLKIPGVQGVFLGRNFITITKSSDIIWQVRALVLSSSAPIHPTIPTVSPLQYHRT